MKYDFDKYITGNYSYYFNDNKYECPPFRQKPLNCSDTLQEDDERRFAIQQLMLVDVPMDDEYFYECLLDIVRQGYGLLLEEVLSITGWEVDAAEDFIKRYIVLWNFRMVKNHSYVRWSPKIIP